MGYTKLFDPNADRLDGDGGGVAGDRRDGRVYVYSPEIVLAVNVALAVCRPLLISGPPGSGKSSLAANVARWQRWRYYEDVVTARTQARDLLWGFDAVRRLSDAQLNVGLPPIHEYVEPGVLWWAFDRESAHNRGFDEEVGMTPLRARLDALPEASDQAAATTGTVAATSSPAITTPVEQAQESDDPKAVVLIDEIDKADPDVPNSLLVALGSLRFTVEETGTQVAASPDAVPFVVITTNDERELPRAFVRRCATLTLSAPDRERLLKIARAQFLDGDQGLHEAVVDMVLQLAEAPGPNPPPSTAEFIDAIRACRELGVTPTSSEWEAIRRILLSKRVSPQAPDATTTG